MYRATGGGRLGLGATVQRPSDEERGEFHEPIRADGEYISSRYRWIVRLERRRPVLQSDGHLERKAEIACNALCTEGGSEVARQAFKETFLASLRRVRDGGNARIDAEIQGVFYDETGDYRRRLLRELAEGAKRAVADLELYNFEESLKRTRVLRQGR